MKKILFLGLMSLLLLSGCNKNNEGVKLLKNSYNYSNKVRYELPVKNYGNVESFLSSINLSKKNFGFKVDYNCNYFDYYDLYHELEHFAVIKHEDGKFTAATNEDLGITKETHKNLFQTYIVKNARASRNFYRQEDPRERGRKGHALVEPDDPNRIID